MTARPDRKVDVFMIGASKCGTTALAEYLDRLGPVSTGRKKEPRHFSRRDFGSLRIEDYHANYAPDCPLWLDASTSYSEVWQDRHARSAARIHAYRPDARILFLIRHPMARIVSEWRQFVYLLDAGNDTIERNYGVHGLRQFSEDIQRFPGLVENARYAAALGPYLDLFPEERICVLRFEDLIACEPGTVAALARVCGLDPSLFGDFALEHRNAGMIKGRANPLGRTLRRLPALKAVGARLPLGVLRTIRPLIKHDPNAGLDLTHETVEHCRAILQDDTRAFLESRGFAAGAYDDWTRFVTP